MTGIARAFPKRPLKVLRHGVSQKWGLSLIPLLIALGILFTQTIYMFPGPSLDTDQGEAANRYFDESGCSRIGIIVWCEDRVRARTATSRETRMASAPVMLIVAAMLLLSGWLARSNLRSRRDWRAVMRTAHVMRPMLAKQVRRPRAVNPFFYFRASAAGPPAWFTTEFGADEAPFVTAAGDYVAVVPEGARIALMLDDALGRLDLTESERDAIRVAAGGAA